MGHYGPPCGVVLDIFVVAVVFVVVPRGESLAVPVVAVPFLVASHGKVFIALL